MKKIFLYKIVNAVFYFATVSICYSQNENANGLPAWHWKCMYSSDVVIIVDMGKSIYEKKTQPLSKIVTNNNNQIFLYKASLSGLEIMYNSPKSALSGQINLNQNTNLKYPVMIGCHVKENNLLEKNESFLLKIIDNSVKKENKCIVFLSYQPGWCGVNGPDMQFDGAIPIAHIDEVNKIITNRVQKENQWNGGLRNKR